MKYRIVIYAIFALGLLISFLAVGVSGVRADLYCGDGGTCPTTAHEYTAITDCAVGPGYCVQTTGTFSRNCGGYAIPGGYRCSIGGASGVNQGMCTSYPNCTVGANATWPDCCQGSGGGGCAITSQNDSKKTYKCGGSCNDNYTCRKKTAWPPNCWCAPDKPKPPTCNSFTEMYIEGTGGNCTSWDDYVAGVPSCRTTSDWVTLRMNVGGSPQNMEFVNAPLAGSCSTHVGGWVDYGPYATSRVWHLPAGVGGKKVCGRFSNADGSVQCGGMTILDAAPPGSCPAPVVTGSSSCDDGTGSGSVTCSWGGLAEASTYRGQIDGDGNIAADPRIVNTENSSTSRTASGLSAGVYQCRARIETGTCDVTGPWNTTINVTVDPCPVPACPTPGSLSGTPYCNAATYESDISWNWSSVPGALEYRLQTDRDNSFTDPNLRTIQNKSDLFHTTKNHADDVNIWGRVRVEDSDGTCGVNVNAWREIGPIRTADCAGSCDISIDFISPMFAYFQEPVWATVLSEEYGFIENIVFSSSDATRAYVNPSSKDWTEAFLSTLYSLEPGNVDITVVGTMDNGVTTCSATKTLEVFNPRAWWQVRDGSAISSTGSISTYPPEAVCAADPNCEPVLIRGDYPGVPMAGGSVTPDAPLTVEPYDSTAGDWSVEGSGFAGISAYNYAYFERKASSAPFINAGSSITGSELKTGTKYQGYRWYKASGSPVTINAPINMGSERAVVFVNGSLQINSTVDLTNGTGFVMFIVSGNIDISETVGGNSPDLKGFYAADGTIRTIRQGTDDDDLPLFVRGSVLAHTAIDLGRKLLDNTVTPAETFEYAYDQALNFPALLAPQTIIWKEIGP